MLQKLSYVLVTALALAGAFPSHGQLAYTVKGNLGAGVQGVIMLDRTELAGGEEKYLVDSVIVKNGQFAFSGKINYPAYARLRLFPVNRTYRDRGVSRFFYIDPGTTLVSGDAGLDAATISGGLSQEEYAGWQAARKPLQDSVSRIVVAAHDLGRAMDDKGSHALQQQVIPLSRQLESIDSVFVATHPHSQVAFDQATHDLKYSRPDIAKLEAVLRRFSGPVLQSAPARFLQEKLAKEKQLQPGHMAPGFTLSDLAGHPISLSSYRGRYVLLVFINYQGNTLMEETVYNLQRACTLLKGDNFALLTILRDSSHAAEVVQNKGLNWTHVIDKTPGGHPDLRSTYNLYGNNTGLFLVGPDGKIVHSSVTLDRDITSQISDKIPGAAERIVKNSPATGPDTPLNVFVGSEITGYPRVEWLKGSPVTHFDKDTIYVVELWATWCVPCIAAMPHLSELQRHFKDKKVVIIAQQVWEDNKDRVTQFVKAKGADLDYRVAFSGPKGSDFDRRWCVPAQVDGIPRTFVIQNGRLVWQTYPTLLNDAVLQLLVDKQFTIAKAEALQTAR